MEVVIFNRTLTSEPRQYVRSKDTTIDPEKNWTEDKSKAARFSESEAKEIIQKNSMTQGPFGTEPA